MNNKMIELVASAIYKEMTFGHPLNDQIPKEIHKHYHKVAKAAIEAMRVPSDEQCVNYYKLSFNTETFDFGKWERSIDAILMDTK